MTHFKSFPSMVNKEICVKFIEKFGSNLVSVNFDCFVNTNPLEAFTTSIRVPNIQKLWVYEFNPQLNDIQFNKLNNFRIVGLNDEDMDEFNVFLERNANTIRHLTISSIDKENEKKFKQLLNKIFLRLSDCLFGPL